VQIVLTAKGTHFDPDVVDAFVAVRDQFREIAARYADDDAALEAHARRYEGRVNA
jgi:putative two-component system response regulator